jgi:hypothetical protein
MLVIERPFLQLKSRLNAQSRATGQIVGAHTQATAAATSHVAG